MKHGELTDEEQHLLNRYSEIGGVVDFVVLECNGSDEDPLQFAAHHSGVLIAMREIQKKIAEYAESTSKLSDIPKSKFFQISIDEVAAANLVPHQISWRQFLGTRYDFERQGLIVHGKGKLLNEFFYYSDAGRPENAYPSCGIDSGIGTGFAYAFSDPPHGLGLPAEEVGVLFDQFLRLLLCGSAASFICEWPTQWSNYFEAGKEWWGSYLWSLSNPGCNRIVVMAASTTD